MVAIQRVGSMLLVSLLLAACGSADEPSKPPPVDETVFRDTVKPMEKARDVENVLQKEKEATDRALDENQ
jgi:hypothetical protein